MTTASRPRPSPLRARRLLRGARLYDVGEATGLHATTLSLLERGERRLTPWLLARLAAYYATPSDRLRAEMERWASPQRPGPQPPHRPSAPPREEA